MRRTAFPPLFISLFCLLPGLPPEGSKAFAGDPSCLLPASVLAPLAPFLPGPAGCAVLALAEPCMPLADPEPCDPPTPVVKIRVRVPACGTPGEPVEYRIHVENCSLADAHHVTVKNAVPPNAKFVRASPEPHVLEPELLWRLGTLKAGTGCDITLVLQPTDLEDLRNCTRVAFEYGQCVTTRLAELPREGRPPVVVPIPKEPGKKPPIMPGADETPQLTLTIDGPKAQYVNVTTNYFVTVENKGVVPATNLLVDFILADKTTFLKANEDGKHLEGKVAWLLGTLEPGKKRTVAVALKAEAAGELCHKATALADKGVNVKAELCTRFQGVSALLLEMFDTEDPIPVGGATSYPILIRNTGTAPVTNLRLKAFIPEALTFTSAKASVRYQLGEPLPGAKVLEFEPLPVLGPGSEANYVVFVVGAKAADARFRIEMRADELERGPVIEEESTRIYAEEGGATPLPQIRDMSLTLPYRP
jgi:uncharacterized repeat protein (TIGR01451 family)